MVEFQRSEVDAELNQSALEYVRLSLVAVMTTPLLSNSLSHTCPTLGPILGANV
jgi:hypothetical protein